MENRPVPLEGNASSLPGGAGCGHWPFADGMAGVDGGRENRPVPLEGNASSLPGPLGGWVGGGWDGEGMGWENRPVPLEGNASSLPGVRVGRWEDENRPVPLEGNASSLPGVRVGRDGKTDQSRWRAMRRHCRVCGWDGVFVDGCLLMVAGLPATNNEPTPPRPCAIDP